MNFAALLYNSIPFLLQLYVDKHREEDLAETMEESADNLNLPRSKAYDFIIVGGGTAGCVLGYRLSQHHSVLLLEAGGNPPPAVSIPAFYDLIYSAPSLNHFLEFENSVANRNLSWIKSTGKMMGGSSSHNGMSYNRGNPLDFDHWANLTNDDSWSYKNVLKYFKLSEDYISGVSDQHGKGGLLTVHTEPSPINPIWFNAAKELGFHVGSPNGPQRAGFTPEEVTRKKGRRVSTYDAFIKPFESERRRLTILRFANVSQILINKHSRASGVIYSRHNAFPEIAYAHKEVIVSCGTFASPMLLMKSGVGPAEVLKKANIPVVADLPVGKNFQDQVGVLLSPIYLNNSELFSTVKQNLTRDSIQDYLRNGKGILSTAFINSYAFLESSQVKKNGKSKWPDLQIIHSISKGDFGVSGVDTPNFLMYVIGLSRPKSRGEITLNTTAYNAGVLDDQQLTAIDSKFLSNPSDISAIVDGIKISLQIMNTTAFQRVGATFSPSIFPSCRNESPFSDAYWECFVRYNVFAFLHAVGTCRMGTGQDVEAVVDPKFRVIGVQGLRVIDASIMPFVTNANTAAPTIMIAEKGAADILDFWK